MNDQEIINRAKEIMADNKSINRHNLAKQLGISRGKLDLMGKKSMLVLPVKLSKSLAASIGRRKSGTMNNFYINKKAPWQLGA